MKLLQTLLIVFTISILSSSAQTARTVQDGFWSDQDTWENGNVPDNYFYGDSIIVNHRVELDEDINMNDGVLVNYGIICSNYYTMYFSNNSTVYNYGYIAAGYITVTYGATFNNYGTVRTNQLTINNNKKGADGIYNEYGTTIQEVLENACPNPPEPTDPDSLSDIVKESITIEDKEIELCEGKGPEYPYSKARYVWDTGAINSDFKPRETRLYFVDIVSKIDGSINRDSVYITVIRSAQSIPNIFTPNNDLINDQFLPDDFPVETLGFYNRWGKNVLNVDDPSNDYEDLSDGLYYYVIEHNSKCILENPLKGWVQINR